jgi:hypothetical protein
MEEIQALKDQLKSIYDRLNEMSADPKFKYYIQIDLTKAKEGIKTGLISMERLINKFRNRK